VIGHGVSFLFRQPFFQSAYDLARAPQGEGNGVPKDLSLGHAGLEQKENKNARGYILWCQYRTWPNLPDDAAFDRLLPLPQRAIRRTRRNKRNTNQEARWTVLFCESVALASRILCNAKISARFYWCIRHPWHDLQPNPSRHSDVVREHYRYVAKSLIFGKEYAAINRKSANEQNRVEQVLLQMTWEHLMDDADLLRNRATRLFALATRSRQQGYPEYAEELDSLAREVVRHAVAIERRFRVAAA
jgi:hypothetical protein